MRHLRSDLGVGALAILAAALTSGCLLTARAQPVDVYYSTSEEVYVSEPMPAPRVEVVQTVAPSPGVLWVDGYWQWGGGSYAWVAGRWSRPSQPGYVWYAPRYQQHGGGRHVYVRGYWGAAGSAGVYRGNGHRGAPPPPARGVRGSSHRGHGDQGDHGRHGGHRGHAR